VLDTKTCERKAVKMANEREGKFLVLGIYDCFKLDKLYFIFCKIKRNFIKLFRKPL